MSMTTNDRPEPAAKSILRKKSTFAFLKIAVALLVLLVLVRKISLREIELALAVANRLYLVAAALALAVNLYFQLKKWQLLVRLEKKSATNGEIFISLLSGYTLGFVTPGRIGEFGRGIFITNASMTRLLGLTLIDKLCSLIMIYSFGVSGFAYFLKRQVHFLFYLPVLITGLLISAALLLLFVKVDRFRIVFHRLIKRWKRYEKIDELFVSLENISANKKIRLLFWALCQTLTYIGQFYVLLRAFTPTAGWLCVLAIASILFAKTLLPISFGDLGIRESAAVFFFGKLGIPAGAAFNASFLLFLINIFSPSMIGLFFILRNRLLVNTKNHNTAQRQ
jgi:uncharacterized membrane protein YbhN (UPF0104 family)